MPKINQLTRASQIADTDMIPKENTSGTSTEAFTAQQLADYVKGKIPAPDTTLSQSGKAADAAKTGAEVTDLKNATNHLDGGSAGQVLRKKTGTDYDFEWASVGQPTDSQTQAAVSAWLEEHPEATTTVDFRVVDKVFDTVAAMIADSKLEAQDNVRTNGYYSFNDGGGAVYQISTTASRACSIQLDSGLYAVLVGDSHNTRQIGIRSGDRAQTTINAYIADTSYTKLTVIDEIHLKKPGAGTSTQNIELVQITRSDFVLAFEGSGRFVLETLNDDYYRMIAIRGTSSTHVNNITICDPVLIGDADTIGLTTGENGHGIFTYYADQIIVYNGNISKCFGDAVYIGHDTSNVNFIGTLYCEECGRQGVSVINGNNIFFDTIVGKNIKRTSPASVIDFEPNNSTQSIVGGVKTVHAINCKKAVCLAGPGDKKIDIGTIISDHTDGQAYDNDLMIYGMASSGDDYNVAVSVKAILVSNQTNRCIDLEYMTESMSVDIDSVIIQGAAKTTANSAAEATVYFTNINTGGTVSNVRIRNIDVIGNTSAVVSLGISQNVAATYKNVEINYRDDSAQLVTCALYGSTIIDTHIKSNKNANGNQFLNSTGEVYIADNATNFTAGSTINHIFIINPNGATMNLYKTNLTGYTINQADFITDGTYYSFAGCKLLILYFNHTNKQINATKIA